MVTAGVILFSLVIGWIAAWWLSVAKRRIPALIFDVALMVAGAATIVWVGGDLRQVLLGSTTSLIAFAVRACFFHLILRRGQ